MNPLKAIAAILTALRDILWGVYTVIQARKESKREEEHQNDHQAIDDDVDAVLRRRGMLTPPDSTKPPNSEDPGLPGDEAGDVRDIRAGGKDQ